MRFTIALIAAAWLAGCDGQFEQPDDVELSCDASNIVTGSIISGPTENVVRSDLLVRGTAEHSAGQTIRRILVAGVAATPDSFNFEQWSATIPIATLASLPGDGDDIEVSIMAIDVCAVEHSLGNFGITVDRSPNVVVERLAFTEPEIPSGEVYVPATGSVAAILRIVGNPSASGARVSLATSLGSFAGDDNGAVILAGNGETDATATVLFSAKSAGTALITATAEDKLASTSVSVVGAPVLFPSSAMLSPGQSVRVNVLTDGSITACQATPAADLTVSSGGADLMAAPAANDVTGDDVVDIDITAATALGAATATTISCEDPYGQFSSATFNAAP